MSTFLKNDLIFYKNEEGSIMSGGYNVESHMLQQDMHPMKTLNFEQSGGKEKFSENFHNLAVPAGLYFITQPPSKSNKEKEPIIYGGKHAPLHDDIFDKLYEMIEYDNKRKRKTRKHIEKPDEPPKKRKTKRQKA
jgi:hypothetical protein